MIQAGFASDDFLPAFRETQARPIRVTNLDVIDRSPLSDIGASGAITVFIARKGSGALDDVRVAVTEGSGYSQKVLDRLRGPTEAPFAGFEISLPEFVQMVVRAPVFADVRYGGEVLNRGLFLPEGLDLAISVFPYNGGRLAREGFSLAEHYQEGTDVALEGLVVRASPPLTAAERAALDKVPEDQSVLNVGTALSCKTTWWAVAVMTAVRAIQATAAVTCFTIVAVQASAAPLSEAELAERGPAASARKLLAIRRDLLLRRPLQ